MSQHSNFKEDPWGRLLRTLDYTSSVIYGGPHLAWEVGGRVREMHKRIKGVRPDGERYHALEPAQAQEFWEEWRRMGRLIGVRNDDLPETWPELLAYFDEMVETELEDTEAAQDVLVSLLRPAAPPVPGLDRDWVWRVVSWPSTKAGSLATLGMLPPTLRDRLGVEWGPAKERRFRRMAAITRRARPLMPPPTRNFGPHYLRWRREAIARGDVASGHGRDAAGTSRDRAPAAA